MGHTQELLLLQSRLCCSIRIALQASQQVSRVRVLWCTLSQHTVAAGSHGSIEDSVTASRAGGENVCTA